MRGLKLLLKPSGYLPVLMSMAALATVIVAVMLTDAARQPDEGAAAHIWQLLMAGQLPIVAVFAIRWLPRSPGPAARVLAVQFVAGLAALAPVYFLHL